jgi:hypothetical protein
LKSKNSYSFTKGVNPMRGTLLQLKNIDKGSKLIFDRMNKLKNEYEELQQINEQNNDPISHNNDNIE